MPNESSSFEQPLTAEITPIYSIVVPVYNEEGSVAGLHADIVQTMTALGKPYEIIFVNDGSQDGTAEVLLKLSPLTVITFRRNTGQSAALDAGIRHARGEIIITLDGDGQNPPSEIPKLLSELHEDVDVVSGWRKHRRDSWSKRFLSRGANFLRKLLVDDGIHDSGCTFKVYRRECFEDLQLMGEMHRFIPALLKIQGFRVREVAVEHRPRTTGVTKYNWSRVLKGFTDMISVWFSRKYAARPLHLFGGAGIIVTLVGALMLVLLGLARFVFHRPLSDSALPLIGVFLFLLGVQFFISGILADIVIKSHYSNGRTVYRIRRIEKH